MTPMPGGEEAGLIFFLTGSGGACCDVGDVYDGGGDFLFSVAPVEPGCFSAFVVLVVVNVVVVGGVTVVVVVFSGGGLYFLMLVAADDGDSDHLSFFSLPTPMDRDRLSMGKGNTMVELCSVEIAFSVCRYL